MDNIQLNDPKTTADKDISGDKQHLPASKDSNGPSTKQSDESIATILPADQSEFVDNNNSQQMDGVADDREVNKMIPKNEGAPQTEIVNGQENDFPEAEEGYFNKE